MAGEQQGSPFERHFQSTMLLVIVALMGFGLQEIVTQGESVARVEVEITSIRADITRLETLSQDRYTATQAARDQLRLEAALALQRDELESIKRRVRDLEKAVEP